MAATKSYKTSKKRDQTLNSLEKQFPGNQIEAKPRICNPEREMASLRQSIRQGASDRFDLSDNLWMLETNRFKYERELEIANRERLHVGIKAEREQLQKMLRAAARHGNQEAQNELAGYRQFEITSDILAMTFALGAFQSINLSADELPLMITPKARQYFSVRWIGQDGGARQDQWRTARSAETMEMRILSTDKIEYQLIDLHEGNVNAYNTISDQLRFDMEMKIDNLALDNLNDNYNATGIKALLNIHPDIDQDNLPDGNYLDLTNVGTYGTANVLTITRIKAILNHMALWGFGFDPDGPITIQNMVMSPLNARDSWDYVDLVSGWDSTGKNWSNTSGPKEDPAQTIPTANRDAIWRNGSMVTNAWGYSWANQFNARITKGRLYVLTNQPVGWFFTKTEFDQVIDWRDQPDNREQNQGQVMMTRALNFFMPSLWRYRYLVVDF